MKAILSKIDELISKSIKKEEGSLDLTLLRLLKTNLVNNQKTSGKLSSEQKVVQKMIKENLKSAAAYKTAGREDLAEKERLEAKILKDVFAEPEVTDIDIKNAIQRAKEIGKKSIGEIMVYIKTTLPDADMKKAFNFAKE